MCGTLLSCRSQCHAGVRLRGLHGVLVHSLQKNYYILINGCVRDFSQPKVKPLMQRLFYPNNSVLSYNSSKRQIFPSFQRHSYVPIISLASKEDRWVRTGRRAGHGPRAVDKGPLAKDFGQYLGQNEDISWI